MDKEREEYFNWKKKSNGVINNSIKRFNLMHVIFICVIIFGGQVATKSGKISPQFYLASIFVVGVSVIFLLAKGLNDKNMLPEHIIKKIVRDALENKKRNGEITYDATIQIDLFSDSKHEQDLESGTTGITNRVVGFKLIRKGYVKKGYVRVHPYSGEILGIYLTNFGWDIKFNKDVRLVPVGSLREKEKSVSL